MNDVIGDDDIRGLGLERDILPRCNLLGSGCPSLKCEDRIRCESAFFTHAPWCPRFGQRRIETSDGAGWLAAAHKAEIDGASEDEENHDRGECDPIEGYPRDAKGLREN
jgi:hypothetical protein